jgi:hypothetical protein
MDFDMIGSPWIEMASGFYRVGEALSTSGAQAGIAPRHLPGAGDQALRAGRYGGVAITISASE